MARDVEERANNGKGMTAYEKFRKSKIMALGHVYEYLDVFLEELFRKVGHVLCFQKINCNYTSKSSLLVFYLYVIV